VARTFHIRTYGCQMNEHDSERLAGLLIADGLEPTDDLEQADIVVFNTCCIRENADNKFYGHLGRLKAVRESRPEMLVAVGGCLAQKERDDVRRRAQHVDVVFGTHNLARAPALLRAAADGGPVVEVLDAPAAAGGDGLPEALGAVRELPYAAWVTIQSGCDNSCAFCIVPDVRGPEVSRPLDELVAEVRALAGRGVTEVTLLGQNVNSYGRDITRRRPLFAELLRAVGAVDGIRRVRYTSPHPKDLRPETVAAMAETPAVCEHLHLPLQSGSDRVLAAMRRGYSAERYLARLAAARAAVKDLAVTTDVIVGFPGETDDDFERTLEVVAEAAYDSAYTFIFSPRPGTRAAAMTEHFVPDEVVAERFERLHAVVERSALARHRARVGRVEEVLVEGTSKRDPAVLTGRTRQNKLVHFAPPPAGAPAPGSYAEVRVDDAAPHHLRGALVRVGAPARVRLRIPVSVSAG
jgi:tRNA-2-methylthio-N6-dimethylallyladenosine synthase